MKSKIDEPWTIPVAAVCFWLATIYTASDVHNFFDNGFGYDASTQWPPRDLFEAVRVLLLAVGWLLYTAFVAIVIALIGAVIVFIGLPVWALIARIFDPWRERFAKKKIRN